jgi:hypothetical protein
MKDGLKNTHLNLMLLNLPRRNVNSGSHSYFPFLVMDEKKKILIENCQ